MYKTILIPIDIAEESSWQKALPVAIEETRRAAGQLHVLAVTPEIPPQLSFLPENYANNMVKTASEKLAELIKKQIPEDVPVHHHIRQGSIYREILHGAQEIGADIIIMASHRPGFKDVILGPNAARVVRHAHCSILVVR